MADLAAELLSLLHERGASDHADRAAQLAELRRIRASVEAHDVGAASRHAALLAALVRVDDGIVESNKQSGIAAALTEVDRRHPRVVSWVGMALAAYLAARFGVQVPAAATTAAAPPAAVEAAP